MTQTFIERQFPVSKVSKESYKERKANNGQTLTGLGKWWGRKPLVLVRAAILGCLLPATDNPEKDMEIFLKIMSMDEEGLLLRKEKKFSVADLYEIVKGSRRLSGKYGNWFYETDGKVKLDTGAPRAEIEEAAFATLGYDARIAMCKRPEQLENISEQAWRDINHHLGTNAHSLTELINQLSMKRFGHNVTVGDCFCGGGSIPFEAARMGCDAYGSDLNPIAGLLTWADMNICGAQPAQLNAIREYLQRIFGIVDREIETLGIERNDAGDRAISYIYCVEVKCPECRMLVPMAPSWVIGKGTKTIVSLIENGSGFDFSVKMGASASEIKQAEKGTATSRGLLCPHCGKTTPLSVIRHDTFDSDGTQRTGLRIWEKLDFIPRPDDVFQERLYAVKYESQAGKRYFTAPSTRDIANENKVHEIVAAHFNEWQEQGLIPSMEIESGYNTDQVIRERGWNYWHQLFNERQLLLLVLIQKAILQTEGTVAQKAAAILGFHKCIDWNSKLCRWNSGVGNEKSEQTYYNQALNTMLNWGTRSLIGLSSSWFYDINSYPVAARNNVTLCDARDVTELADIWFTDPPYADAVNYHELTELFLAWDKTSLPLFFPDWYTDSKRILAVRGDEHFSQTMIDIYSNLTRHMSDDGMQIVMFTHSDPAVWAQLALIMWKAGLTVTAAWNIATETDASGLKDGNYVKGTVLLVLRKQQGEEEAFLDELAADIKSEVKRQIESMQKLDDKEDPNFSDPDYVLAAYAASLKVLTGYRAIGEIDLDYELNLAIHDPAKSEVVKLIERAKKIAYDFIIPLDFDNFLWRELSPAERFYVKGLEAEKHGNYQISTYQEYARGFGLTSYSQLMASERANTARLKTPQEFAMRSINEVPEFEQSILRLVLAAIHVAIKEDENPEKGFWHIRNNLADYWNKRDMLRQLLSFLRDTEDIDTMEHWREAGAMANHIYTLIDNDHI